MNILHWILGIDPEEKKDKKLWEEYKAKAEDERKRAKAKRNSIVTPDPHWGYTTTYLPTGSYNNVSTVGNILWPGETNIGYHNSKL